MANVLEKPITSKGGVTLLDGFAVVGGKMAADIGGSMVGFVGSRNVTGGLMKMGAALAISSFSGNRYIRAAALGVALSGVEDTFAGVMNGNYGLFGGKKESTVSVEQVL